MFSSNCRICKGHVFKKDFTLFLEGDNMQDVFQILDDFTSAKEFVINLIRDKPKFECCIYNQHGEHIITYNIITSAGL